MAMESGGRRSPRRSPEPCDEGATKAVPDVVVSLSDKEIQDKLERLTSFLSGNGLSALPDKGKKIRLQVQQLKDELERRRQQSVRVVNESAENCERISLSKCAESSGSVERRLANQQVDKESPSSFAKAFNEKFQQKEGVTTCGDNKRAAGEEKCKNIIKNNLKLHGERKEKEKEKVIEKDKEKEKEETQRQGTVSCRDVPFKSIDLISSGEKSRCAKSCNGTSTRLESNSSSVPAKRKRDHDSSISETALKKEVVLLDIDGQTPRGNSTEWEELKVYYPSPEHPEMVELSSSDMDCLGPEKYLSSTVMNFYAMYLQLRGSGSPAGVGTDNYYFFNTYFYNKLEEFASPKGKKRLSFLKLRRWWKGVNLFKKAYIFMPVYGEMHWSLVIICMPPEDDNAGLMVLHLDSLKYHRSNSIFNNVNKFLKEEWTFVDHNTPDKSEIPMNQRVWKNLPRRIESKAVTVPQQENEYDCGLFVLHFLEYFMGNAPERLTKDYRSKLDNKWFPTVDASALRHKIRGLLEDVFEANLLKEKPESISAKDGPCQDNRNVDAINL